MSVICIWKQMDMLEIYIKRSIYFSYLPEDGDGTYKIVNDSDKFMLKLEK